MRAARGTSYFLHLVLPFVCGSLKRQAWDPTKGLLNGGCCDCLTRSSITRSLDEEARTAVFQQKRIHLLVRSLRPCGHRHTSSETLHSAIEAAVTESHGRSGMIKDELLRRPVQNQKRRGFIGPLMLDSGWQVRRKKGLFRIWQGPNERLAKRSQGLRNNAYLLW